MRVGVKLVSWFELQNGWMQTDGGLFLFKPISNRFFKPIELKIVRRELSWVGLLLPLRVAIVCLSGYSAASINNQLMDSSRRRRRIQRAKTRFVWESITKTKTRLLGLLASPAYLTGLINLALPSFVQCLIFALILLGVGRKLAKTLATSCQSSKLLKGMV